MVNYVAIKNRHYYQYANTAHDEELNCFISELRLCRLYQKRVGRVHTINTTNAT